MMPAPGAACVHQTLTAAPPQARSRAPGKRRPAIARASRLPRHPAHPPASRMEWRSSGRLRHEVQSTRRVAWHARKAPIHAGARAALVANGQLVWHAPALGNRQTSRHSAQSTRAPASHSPKRRGTRRREIRCAVEGGVTWRDRRRRRRENQDPTPSTSCDPRREQGKSGRKGLSSDHSSCGSASLVEHGPITLHRDPAYYSSGSTRVRGSDGVARSRDENHFSA